MVICPLLVACLRFWEYLYVRQMSWESEDDGWQERKGQTPGIITDVMLVITGTTYAPTSGIVQVLPLR
jgi:hypothetical protein